MLFRSPIHIEVAGDSSNCARHHAPQCGGGYLHDKYGSLGFIVTRGTDENLHKEHEIDWMREMYFTHKVLIVKLPAKFLTRVLSKLRSPEKYDTVDRLLNALLDTYERNYLSLKVTRKSRERNSAGQKKAAK